MAHHARSSRARSRRRASCSRVCRHAAQHIPQSRAKLDASRWLPRLRAHTAPALGRAMCASVDVDVVARPSRSQVILVSYICARYNRRASPGSACHCAVHGSWHDGTPHGTCQAACIAARHSRTASGSVRPRRLRALARHSLPQRGCPCPSHARSDTRCRASRYSAVLCGRAMRSACTRLG